MRPMSSFTPSLADIVATLHVDQIGPDDFVATQLDNPAHHIVGGHIAGQALMAASRTAPGRDPHSIHVYYIRAGDARRPVDFHVMRARDGGTLSTRQIVARQDGEVLLEALASFSTPLDGLDYHGPIPDVPAPESLLGAREQLADYADELGGYWVRPIPSSCATWTRRHGWPKSCPSRPRVFGCGGGHPRRSSTTPTARRSCTAAC